MELPGRQAAYLGVGYTLALAFAGAGVPSPLYSVYRQEFGFSAGVLALIFSTYSLVLLPTLLFAGPLSDRLGRRPLLLAGLVLTAAASALFIAADGTGWLFAARAVQGTGVAIVNAAGTAALAELHPRGDQRRAALLVTLATAGGLGLGALAVGALAEYAPWPLRLVYVLHLALLFLAALIILVIPEPAPSESAVSWRPRRPWVPPDIRGTFALASATAFSAWAVAALFLSVAPSYATQLARTHNLAVLGGVTFVMLASSMVGQLAGRAVAARRATAGGLGLLVAGLGAVSAAFPSHSLWVLFAGALLAGGGLGLAFLGALSTVNHIAPEQRRAEVTAAFFVWLFLGNGLSVLGVGFLSGPLSLASAVYVFAAAIGATALVTALLAVRNVGSTAHA